MRLVDSDTPLDAFEQENVVIALGNHFGKVVDKVLEVISGRCYQAFSSSYIVNKINVAIVFEGKNHLYKFVLFSKKFVLKQITKNFFFMFPKKCFN